MADNIGGIIKAEYCITEDLSSCGVTPRGIAITSQKSEIWEPFPAVTGNINLAVTPEQKNGISLYRISGEILCARYQFADETEMNLLNDARVIIRKTMANGDELVCGDKENPVTISAEKLTPSSPSGFTGVRYTLSGLMTHPELPVL